MPNNPAYITKYNTRRDIGVYDQLTVDVTAIQDRLDALEGPPIIARDFATQEEVEDGQSNASSHRVRNRTQHNVHSVDDGQRRQPCSS
jgi:hypothetical protein